MMLRPLYLTRKETVVLIGTFLQFAVTQAEHHLSQSFSCSGQTTGRGPVIHAIVHGFGLLVFSKLWTFWFISIRRGFLLGWQPCVWSEHWLGDLLLFKPLQQCWLHSCVCLAWYGGKLLLVVSWVKEEQRGIGQGEQTRRGEAPTHTFVILKKTEQVSGGRSQSGKMLNCIFV